MIYHHHHHHFLILLLTYSSIIHMTSSSSSSAAAFVSYKKTKTTNHHHHHNNDIISSLNAVPERMLLSTSMKNVDITQATLIPLEIDTEKKTVQELESKTASQVLSEESEMYGTICFAVRRPGWVLCREDGKAIHALFQQSDQPLHGFGLFGVLKETKVDDNGISDFQSIYFPHSLYYDQYRTFYQALGNRTISIPWKNPIKLVRGIFQIRRLGKRLKSKGIEGNFIGEGLFQGGMIIFNKDGMPVYAYEEQTGLELPIDDIVEAVKAVRDASK